MYLLFWVLDIWEDGGDIGGLPDDRMLLRKREAKQGWAAVEGSMASGS